MKKIGYRTWLVVFGLLIITSTVSITLLFAVNTSNEEGDISLRIANDNNLPILESNFTWGYEDLTRGLNIAVDSSGSMYVGGISVSERTKVYVLVKFDSEGNELWNYTWSIGPKSFDFFEGLIDITLDNDENIYFISSYIDWGHCFVWLFKFQPNGNELWNISWGSTEESDDYGFGVTTDNFGNVYVCGSTQTTGTSDQLCVIKFNSDGEEIWNFVRKESLAGDHVGLTLDLDGQGNIYVAAYLGDKINGDDEFCIVKLNPNGEEIWNFTRWADSDEISWSIAVDSIGNSYFTGFTLDYGSGEEDIHVYKLSPTGEKLWNATWGGISTDMGFDIAIDSYGNSYISGTTYSYDQGEGDICIIKYTPTGTQLWNLTWGGVEPELGGGILIDDDQNIYITGMSYSLEPGGIVVLVFTTEDQGNGEILPIYYIWLLIWLIFQIFIL